MKKFIEHHSKEIKNSTLTALMLAALTVVAVSGRTEKATVVKAQGTTLAGSAAVIADTASTVLKASESIEYVTVGQGSSEEIKEEPVVEVSESQEVEEPAPKPVGEVIEQEAEEPAPLQINDVSYTRYASTALNVREQPDANSKIVGGFKTNDIVSITGEIVDNNFVRVDYNGTEAFVSSKYLSETEIEVKAKVPEYQYTGAGHLTKKAGVYYGPSGKETYYNLPMGGCIRLMDEAGIEHGEYWVRSDGCKMLGDYIMVAADLSVHPKGTLVETSLGTGIVCDTGTFIYMSGGSNWIDIAVAW